MTVTQISKIQMRRGPEIELPGAPTSVSPLVFEPGLDIGEIGYAVDTGRLFIGHAPNYGQPNYKRTDLPYQNIEILTEASTETLRRIFNFLRRDLGSGAFYMAVLEPTSEWKPVRIERSSGGSIPFRIPGEDLIARIEYYIVTEHEEFGSIKREPYRQGVMRVLSETTADEASISDENHSIRRLDLLTPEAVEPEKAYSGIHFRMVKAGAIGDPYFVLEYISDLDETARMYFDISRPLGDGHSVYESFTTTHQYNNTGVTGLTREDVEDIVGAMVTNNFEKNIVVTYDDERGKLNFEVVETEEKAPFRPFRLTLTGHANGGSAFLDGDDVELPLVLSPTGVEPGTYSTPIITVDATGRITKVEEGGEASRISIASVGGGRSVYAGRDHNEFQFKSFKPGHNVLLVEENGAIVIHAGDFGVEGGFLSVIDKTNPSSPVSYHKTGEIEIEGSVEVSQPHDGRVTLRFGAYGGGGGDGSLSSIGVTDHLGVTHEATSLSFPQSAVRVAAQNGTATISMNFVDRDTDQTIKGRKTFEADVTVEGGQLSITSPSDPYAGIEAPYVSGSQEKSAYWYFDSMELAWTAYLGDRHPGPGQSHPFLSELASVRASRFIGKATDSDHADNADDALRAQHSVEADHAALADHATLADDAIRAQHAVKADHAALADRATLADDATKLKTPRTIGLSGVVQGSATFDGSGNVTIATSRGPQFPPNLSVLFNGSTIATDVQSITFSGTGISVSASGSAVTVNIQAGTIPPFNQIGTIAVIPLGSYLQIVTGNTNIGGTFTISGWSDYLGTWRSLGKFSFTDTNGERTIGGDMTEPNVVSSVTYVLAQRIG